MTPWSRTLLAAAVLGGLAGCALDPQPSPIPTPQNRVVKVDHQATAAGVISYISQRGSPAYDGSVEDAVEVRSRADLRELRGAPDDFKAFIADQLTVLAAEAAAALTARGFHIEACDFASEIRVWGIADGVATGRERACEQDSNDVIWAKVNDAWRPVARMQGGWDCAVLDRYRVPADITAAVCWYDDVETRPYDGPRS